MSISTLMLNILERLAEMFPNESYQTRLESYLSRKSITDAATLENYIKEFEYKSHKEM
jgi:urease accessory protein UreF